MCSGHYHRLRRYGDPEFAPPPRPVSKCSIEGCDGDVAGAGYCRKHYKRLRAHGDPLAGGIEKGAAKRFVRELIQADPVDECIPWPFGKNSEGRGRINWNGRPTNADAAVLEASVGTKPTPKHETCHRCGNGHLGCVNPSHLYWGTRKENVADAIRHGTAYLLERAERYGEKSPASRYSDAVIAEIRDRISKGERQVDLASEFGMSKTHVNRIWKGTIRVGPPANDNVPAEQRRVA